MQVWALAICLSLLPLALLTVWTFTFKRGAGPQGGEFLAMGWMLLFLWLGLSGFITALLYCSTLKVGNWLRFGTIPLLAVFVEFIVLAALTALLNHSTLPELSNSQSRIEIALVAIMTTLVIAGQLSVILRIAR